jgi:hypothetical protein
MDYTYESSGKEMLSLNLVLHILSLIDEINYHNTNVIALEFHEVHPQSISPIKQSSPIVISVETAVNMPEKRTRKKPVTKTNDFYGIFNLIHKYFS